MQKALVLILLLVLSCSFGVQASSLYSGEAPVTGQEREERNQAMPSALIHALQKLSGRRELPVGPELDAALQSASRIAVSFRYETREHMASDGSLSEDSWLVVDFLPDAVDRIIRDMQLPRWRQEREPVTIWVIVDDGFGRRLLPVEYEYARRAMGDIAALRGLPVVWPEVNENEESPVDLQLLWGGFIEELVGVGQGPVLVIAARRDGAEWSLRWNYSDADETAGWRTRGRDLAQALAGGMHGLVDLVASSQTIEASRQNEWQLTVEVHGLHGATDYARALAYLQDISLVERVDIALAAPGKVRFQLVLNAMPQYLVDTIASGGVLKTMDLADGYLLLPPVEAADAYQGE